MNRLPLFTLLLAALCVAGLSACTTPSPDPDLHLHCCAFSPQKAIALQKEAALTACITDGGAVAYLVRGHHICKDAASAATMLQQEQKPIIVHISYLATMPMVKSAVSPFLKTGVPVQYITTVNNQDVVPCVYLPVAVDRSHK